MYVVYSILCVLCLLLGYYLGLNAKKDKIEIPHPIEQVKKKREQKEADEEFQKAVEKYSTILENINNYDGSSNNQRKVN